MMPDLLKGDRLVVSKYPYGWSWVIPKLPRLAALGRAACSARCPERGDIVIVTPPGQSDDYIKRVIGLPGDTVEVRDGRLILNGKPVPSRLGRRRWSRSMPMRRAASNSPAARSMTADGQAYCRLPIVRETLPNGVTYDTIDLGPSPGDDFGPIRVPAGHLFLMGDNRDRSADSRFSSGRRRTAWAGRCRGRISAAAPNSSPSRSTARPSCSIR